MANSCLALLLYFVVISQQVNETGLPSVLANKVYHTSIYGDDVGAN